MKHLGPRIKSARESLGLSQQELSIRCGWDSQSRIGNYETGAREPSLQDLDRLAKALKKSISFFVETEEERQSLASGRRAQLHEEMTPEYELQTQLLALWPKLTGSQRTNLVREAQIAYELNEEILTTYRASNAESE